MAARGRADRGVCRLVVARRRIGRLTAPWEWVLRSRYGLDKAALLAGFVAMLETQEFERQHEGALERALDLLRRGSADFADCLHAGASHADERGPLLMFDVKAAKLDGVRRIGT
jgi:predicted nucleic-acid-binding protein